MNFEKVKDLIEMQTELTENYERLMSLKTSAMLSNYEYPELKAAMEAIAMQLKFEVQAVEPMEASKATKPIKDANE